MAVTAEAVVINTGKNCKFKNKNAFIQQISVATVQLRRMLRSHYCWKGLLLCGNVDIKQ